MCSGSGRPASRWLPRSRTLKPVRRARGGREEDLPTVARRPDACSAMDVEAHVPVFGELRLPDVDAHPDPDVALAGPRLFDECPLALDGCADCVVERVECREDLIAVRVDDRAPVARHRLAENPPDAVQDRGIVGSRLVDETRRSLDVAEEKRDRAGIVAHPARV